MSEKLKATWARYYKGLGWFLAGFSLFALVGSTGLPVAVPFFGQLKPNHVRTLCTGVLLVCILCMLIVCIRSHFSNSETAASRWDLLPPAGADEPVGRHRLLLFAAFVLFPLCATVDLFVQFSGMVMYHDVDEKSLSGWERYSFPPDFANGVVWRFGGFKEASPDPTKADRPSAFPGAQPWVYTIFILADLGLFAFWLMLWLMAGKKVQSKPTVLLDPEI